jgi:hypothetical protein
LEYLFFVAVRKYLGNSIIVMSWEKISISGCISIFLPARRCHFVQRGSTFCFVVVVVVFVVVFVFVFVVVVVVVVVVVIVLVLVQLGSY